MRRNTKASVMGLRNASDITPIKAKNLPSLPRGIFKNHPCTDCGAECGQPCVSSNGRIMDGSYHRARKHKAMRQWHAEREMQTVELPDPTD